MVPTGERVGYTGHLNHIKCTVYSGYRDHRDQGCDSHALPLLSNQLRPEIHTSHTNERTSRKQITLQCRVCVVGSGVWRRHHILGAVFTIPVACCTTLIAHGSIHAIVLLSASYMYIA